VLSSGAAAEQVAQADSAAVTRRLQGQRRRRRATLRLRRLATPVGPIVPEGVILALMRGWDDADPHR